MDMSTPRVILIIADACGIGELPDAADYGDTGAATVPNVAAAVGGLSMPACQALGLGNIVEIEGVPPAPAPAACFGKMAERSPGKDSTTGHWEIGGVILDAPFPVFPDGFPPDLVARFEAAVGVKAIGNVAASGTEIVERLGEEHLKSGALILYTSADSVFQVAAHEAMYPPKRLYEICQTARDLLIGEFDVGRVIARPFEGRPGQFVRTSRRRDFSRTPPEDTLLDVMARNDLRTLAIGKIKDLYAGRGIDSAVKAANNDEVMEAAKEAVSENGGHALVFANCVDFDMLWGHRNDERSFARGLESFDRHLSELLLLLREDDVLVITADHGCDPTIKSSTDHTREYVPLLVHGRRLKSGVDLGTRSTFADLATTLAEAYDLPDCFPGTSMWSEMTNAH